MSDSSSYSDETPPLPFAAFDPIDSEETEAGHRDENDDAVEPPVKAASESKGSLDRIVTRLDDNRPPKWAMNWRPTGEEAEAAEASGDHHPARIAATEAPMPHESPEEPDTPNSLVGSTSQTETTGDAEPVNTTSRTWVPTSPAGGRPEGSPHPTAPRADATGRVVTDGPTSRPPSGDRAGRSGRGGWMVATAVLVAWLVTDFWPENGSGETPTESSPESGPAAVLARPAPVVPMDPGPELALLREEVSILQNERAAMNAELDAAGILVVDHQRLTTENTRSIRRWRTAIEQLEFLDEALESATLERARMAAELALVQRMLDEARGNE
ncbi:MAG: hypothetical protein CMJ51_04420 [Planctomycetaceae bacterium]|nr:hypothetical protein [Planctomycetaceae bacterium]